MSVSYPFGSPSKNPTAPNFSRVSRNKKSSGKSQYIATKPPVDPDRYMFFATRAKMPSGTLVTTVAGMTYICTKIIVNTPTYMTKSFRFHLSGFAGTEGGNSPQETLVTGTIGTPGNSVFVDSMAIKVNGQFYPCLFNGSESITIADQTNGAWCDEVVTPEVKPESAIEIWTFYHVNTVGDKVWPVYRVQHHRNERVWSASDLSTLLAYKESPNSPSTELALSSTGSAGYGQQTQYQHYGPDMMVAKGGWDGRPVALVLADSLGESRQEYGPNADLRGNLGWLRKWLDNPSSEIGRIPSCFMGYPGAKSQFELTGSGSTIATRRWAILDECIAFNGGKWPFTVALNQLGQNDTNTVYGTWFGYYNGLVTRLRNRYTGIKVVALPPLGRTDNTRTVTLTSVGTTVTATVATGTAEMVSGQTLSIAGATPTAYNGNYTITVTGANSFTYEFAGGTSPATGTITAGDSWRDVAYQRYATGNAYPADTANNNTGKWRLRDDILAKTSGCCDDFIDTYNAWVSSKQPGKWPDLTELPYSTVATQAGTDGVATYQEIIVDDGSSYQPEQDVVTFSSDGLTILSRAPVVAIEGNVLKLLVTRSVVLPVGSRVYQMPSTDGVHPYPVMIRKVANSLPQSEKTKLIVT